MADGDITCTFTPLTSDLWRASISALRRRPRRIAGFTAFAVAVGTLAAATSHVPNVAVFLIVVALFVVVYWGLNLLCSYVQIRRSRRVHQPRTMTFGEFGVDVVIATSTTHYSWTAFDKVWVEPTGFVVLLSEPRCFYWVPGSAFVSRDEESRCLQLVRTNIAASRTGGATSQVTLDRSA
jgi:hypothetical protein